MKKYNPSPTMSTLWVMAVVLNSGYCFVWDVLMDWGLLKWESGRGWVLQLRDSRLVATKNWHFYVLMLFNFCLRFIWSVKVFGVTDRGAGMFFFEIVEILR